MHAPHRGIEWDNVPLGQKPDTVLARELGVTNQVVWEARSRRGIARFGGARTQIDWSSLPLGEQPDRAVARQVGVSRRTVAYHRARLGIGPFVGLVLTQEGQPCRSVYEATYDACLHEAERPHEHEVHVPGLPYIADFLVDHTFVELAAMTGFERYAAKHQQKRLAYRKHRIHVQWLTASDVTAMYMQATYPFDSGVTALDRLLVFDPRPRAWQMSPLLHAELA